MSIQLKVWLIAGLAWLLASIVIASSVVGVKRANDALINLNSGALATLEESNQYTQDLLLLHNEILTNAFWRLLNADEAKLKAAEERLLADLEQIKETFRGTVSEERVSSYLAHVRTAFILMKRNPRIGFMNFTGTASLFEELLTEHRTRLQQNKALARQETEQVVQRGNETVVFVLVIALSIGALIIVFSAVFSRSIVSSIRGLTTTMKTLAADDLTIDIPDLDRRDELGQMARAVSIFKDGAIERHRIEKDLAEYREHLEELVEDRTQEVERQKRQIQEALNRERELNGLQRQFVAMVSHEFRTPLAVIDGNAQRLLRRLDKLGPDRVREGLGKVRKSVVNLTDLMESVLSSARLEEGRVEYNPEPCDLPGLLGDLCSSYSEINGDHKIIFDVDQLPNSIVADRRLLRQVFSNLLSNAIKYSPGAQRVWVTGERHGDDELVVSIRDEGLGIPPEELKKLFDRFFRASTSTGIAGSGIGLHLVKHFVDLHKGSIEVESTVDAGTTFSVRLPVVCSENAIAGRAA